MSQKENNPILENYVLLNELGGQKIRKFGTTYLAERKIGNEKVIVKTIDLNRNANLQSQFINEQYFSFEAKGLPKVIDFIQDKDRLYLVKEFQKGEQLDHYWKQLKRKEQLSFIIDFVPKISELLSFIHVENIIHCDLKPSNILIEKTYSGINVSIIDFGMAVQQPILEKRKLIFPLGYAAPELILNRLELINKTTDYFSLGIIIWRLFCEELPLSHPNPSIFTNLQLVHPLIDHKKLPKGMIEVLNRLCRKPSFKTAPNRMKNEEVTIQLIESQQLREIQFKNLSNDLKLCKTKKWFQF